MDKPSTSENEYFERQEAQRREQLRQKAEAAAQELQRREVTARAAGTDVGLAERLHVLGFEGENARILDLLPLIAVAWADGSVSQKERTTILKIVEGRGIPAGSEPWTRILAWLEKYPSETLRDEVREVLLQVISRDPARVNDVLSLCYAVADAAGGIFGVGSRISESERAMIEAFAAQFSEQARKDVSGG